MYRTIALLLAYAGAGLTAPLEHSESGSLIFERADNPCPALEPGKGSSPNTDYYNGQPGGCPPKRQLDADGGCTSGFDVSTAGSYCTSYCEIKNSYFYGQEVPFTQYGSCAANEGCSFTSSDALTITQSYAINVGIKLGKRDLNNDSAELDLRDLALRDLGVGDIAPGFNAGATYTYSTATTISTGLTLSRPSDTMANCGYWTFVPIFWTSCGSYSIAKVGPDAYWSTNYECLQPYDTTGNYCNSYPYLDSNGNPAGETVFVLIDCNTKQQLPLDQQDPTYQRPGVQAAGAVP